MPRVFEQQFVLEPSANLTSSWTIPEAITAILGGILVWQIIRKYLDDPLNSITETLWNAFVYAMPAPLVYGLCSTQNRNNNSNVALNWSMEHAQKSETLRNALGIRTGRSILTNIGSGTSSAPKGLGNLDHSCYQNSVLQALASARPMQEYLEHVVNGSLQKVDATTIDALHDLTSKLNRSDADYSYFWTPAKLKTMSSWQQQDAQEYFSMILDTIEKEIQQLIKRRTDNEAGDLSCLKSNNAFPLAGNEEKEALKQSAEMATTTDTRVQDACHGYDANPFEGLMAQRVGCIKCGYCEGLSLVPFNCLTLPLGGPASCDLEHCLNASTELEKIEGVECSSCSLIALRDHISNLLKHSSTPDASAGMEKHSQRLELVQQALNDHDFSEETLRTVCAIPDRLLKSSTKTKQAVLLRAPKSLVLHINRSVFDERTGEQLKNYAAVNFPVTLDVRPWMVGGSENGDDLMEEWKLDPLASMLPSKPLANSGNHLYRLTAAIVHQGRHENGHYICYRQSLPKESNAERRHEESSISFESADASNVSGGPWWRISDESVIPVPLEAVLAQNEVFMLFYEQVPSVQGDEIPEDNSAEEVESQIHESSNKDADNDCFEDSPANAPETDTANNASVNPIGASDLDPEPQVTIMNETYLSLPQTEQLRLNNTLRMKTGKNSSAKVERTMYTSHHVVDPT
ncbi:MAG: hypothetical protein Q9162_002730 [Coniocarpon cinnabarinum]